MSDHESKIIPNSFQTPNAYVDEAMYLLTPEEYKVLSFIDRHILGWQEKVMERKSAISLTMLVNGYQSKKTGRWFHGTGLSRPTVNKCLDALTAYGFVIPEGKPGPKGQVWVIGDYPDYDGLRERYMIKQAETDLRMARVRGKCDLPVNEIDPAQVNVISPEPTIYDLRKQRHAERQSPKTKDKDFAASHDAAHAPSQISVTPDTSIVEGREIPTPAEHSPKAGRKSKGKNAPTIPLPPSAPAALGLAWGVTLVQGDFPSFNKVAQTLIKSTIPVEEFPAYVTYWRERSQKEGWTLATVHALTGAGRMSEYVAYRTKQAYLMTLAYPPQVDPSPEDMVDPSEVDAMLKASMAAYTYDPTQESAS